MLFDGTITNVLEDTGEGISQYMRTDIQEKDGNYLLEIELPGFKRENIEAELTDGKLTIIAKKPEGLESEEKKINFIRRERLIGGCKRTFYVGDTVKQDDIKASFCDGVLSVLIANLQPAVDEQERKMIPIM